MWEYFSKVYVISIPSSNRKNDIHNNFKKIGINNYEIIDFKPASKIINNGSDNIDLIDIFSHNHCDITCENISNNHLALIEKAYNDNLDNVLIFEDDAIFELPFDYNKLNIVIQWLKNNNWDLFYFGYCAYPIPVVIPVSQHIVKIFSPFLAHSYAVSRNGMKYIINNKDKFKTRHIDSVYAELPLKKYGVWKNMCFQSNDPALYKKAMNMLNLSIPLKDITKFLEIISLYIPFILVFMIIYIVVRLKTKINS
jgi:hypothetical protein